MIMKPALQAVFAAAILSVGHSPAMADDHADAATMPAAGEFNRIERFGLAESDARDLASFYLRDFGISPSDAEFQEADDASDPSKRVLLVTADGLRDDAVKGIQLRFSIQSSGGLWRALEVGIRRKCYRGESIDTWQKAICP